MATHNQNLVTIANRMIKMNNGEITYIEKNVSPLNVKEVKLKYGVPVSMTFGPNCKVM